ncbi:MAG: ribosome recycling factor [Patescibacteria group bacterium]|nr:ribosome recycling factor [Patescibacteria group bacterium]
MIKNNFLQLFEEQTQSLINQFKEEISSLRTNRPSTALVENLKIDCYNAQSPLKHLASISITLPNIIIIEPWDISIVPNVRKALETSSLGLTPQIEGKQIKLFLPPLTRERKENLIKLLNSQKEDTRVKLRKIREEVVAEIKKSFEEKNISEDEKFRLLEEVQKLVEKTNKSLEEITQAKEQEILES